METSTTRRRLNSTERQALRTAIDHAVRARLGTPTWACPECGASLIDLPAPVHGCTTCHNRYSLRRRRATKR